MSVDFRIYEVLIDPKFRHPIKDPDTGRVNTDATILRNAEADTERPQKKPIYNPVAISPDPFTGTFQLRVKFGAKYSSMPWTHPECVCRLKAVSRENVVIRSSDMPLPKSSTKSPSRSTGIASNFQMLEPSNLTIAIKTDSAWTWSIEPVLPKKVSYALGLSLTPVQSSILTKLEIHFYSHGVSDIVKETSKTKDTGVPLELLQEMVPLKNITYPKGNHSADIGILYREVVKRTWDQAHSNFRYDVRGGESYYAWNTEPGDEDARYSDDEWHVSDDEDTSVDEEGDIKMKDVVVERDTEKAKRDVAGKDARISASAKSEAEESPCWYFFMSDWLECKRVIVNCYDIAFFIYVVLHVLGDLDDANDLRPTVIVAKPFGYIPPGPLFVKETGIIVPQWWPEIPADHPDRVPFTEHAFVEARHPMNSKETAVLGACHKIWQKKTNALFTAGATRADYFKIAIDPHPKKFKVQCTEVVLPVSTKDDPWPRTASRSRLKVRYGISLFTD